MDLQELSLDLIDHPPVEMRAAVEQEYIEGLANSIKEVGLLHPLHVQLKDGRYVITSGNCRFLACKLLQKVTVPCFVDHGQEANIPAMTMHENLMRRDVSHMDTARFLVHLKEEQKLSVEELAKRFRYSTTWVYQHLKLMECDQEIREAIDSERVNWQAGLELMKIPDEHRRRVLLDSAVRGGATYNVIKGWVATELVAMGARQPQPPVSMGQAMNAIPEMTFVCACCIRQFNTDKCIQIRTCPECYSVVQQAMKVLREQESSVHEREPQAA